MLHSLATMQGTDWRENDPAVEPLVEIYQGYHAAYEYEGGPRAETDAYQVNIHGGYDPLGFYWNGSAQGLQARRAGELRSHLDPHFLHADLHAVSEARGYRREHAASATSTARPTTSFSISAPIKNT